MSYTNDSFHLNLHANSVPRIVQRPNITFYNRKYQLPNRESNVILARSVLFVTTWVARIASSLTSSTTSRCASLCRSTLKKDDSNTMTRLYLDEKDDYKISLHVCIQEKRKVFINKWINVSKATQRLSPHLWDGPPLPEDGIMGLYEAPPNLCPDNGGFWAELSFNRVTIFNFLFCLASSDSFCVFSCCSALTFAMCSCSFETRSGSVASLYDLCLDFFSRYGVRTAKNECRSRQYWWE